MIPGVWLHVPLTKKAMTRRKLLLPGIAGILLITAAIISVWNVNGDPATTSASDPASPTHENRSSAAHASATVAAATSVPNAKGERAPTITAATPARDVVSTPGTAAQQNMITHTVQAGETLFRIAHSYGVPVDTLATANHISDPTRIYVGQTLIIPAVKPVPAVASTPVAPTAGRASDNPGLITPAMGGASGNPGIVTPTFDSASSDLDIARPRYPRLPPAPTTLNGIPIDTIVVMPDDVKQHIREIYASGLALGRDPHAFSKAGDSTIENPYFLTRFDGGQYNLGDYAYLQPVIDYFTGSYSRQGMAVRRGLHSWSMLNPTWADKTNCQPNETPIACEFRLHNPSVVLIRLGANDVDVAKSFDKNLRQIVELSIDNGVIPVLGTKADRHEGPGNINNNIIRQVAADYKIPLWDFDLVAQTIPGSGLDADSVHMTTFYAHDYSLPEAFQRGHSVHNLTALIVLDKVWKVVTQT